MNTDTILEIAKDNGYDPRRATRKLIKEKGLEEMANFATTMFMKPSLIPSIVTYVKIMVNDTQQMKVINIYVESMIVLSIMIHLLKFYYLTKNSNLT